MLLLQHLYSSRLLHLKKKVKKHTNTNLDEGRCLTNLNKQVGASIRKDYIGRFLKNIFHTLNAGVKKPAFLFEKDSSNMAGLFSAIRNLRLKTLLSPVSVRTDFQPIHAVHASSTDIYIHYTSCMPEVPVSTCVCFPVPMHLTVQYICF